MSYLRRAVPLLAVVAIAGLAACGDDDDATTPGNGPGTAASTVEKATTRGAPAVPTIVVRDGQPVGGVEELEYDAGEQVRFRVRSDVAEEIHVHGYELTKDVPAGGSVSFSFPAEIEGIFEVELEGRAEQIVELRVNP